MRTLIAAASALGLVIAPVAASAGTRANDVVPAAAKIDRDTAAVTDASQMGGTALIVALIAIAAVIAGILAATSDGNGVSDG